MRERLAKIPEGYEHGEGRLQNQFPSWPCVHTRVYMLMCAGVHMCMHV